MLFSVGYVRLCKPLGFQGVIVEVEPASDASDAETEGDGLPEHPIAAFARVALSGLGDAGGDGQAAPALRWTVFCLLFWPRVSQGCNLLPVMSGMILPSPGTGEGWILGSLIRI